MELCDILLVAAWTSFELSQKLGESNFNLPSCRLTARVRKRVAGLFQGKLNRDPTSPTLLFGLYIVAASTSNTTTRAGYGDTDAVEAIVKNTLIAIFSVFLRGCRCTYPTTIAR